MSQSDCYDLNFGAERGQKRVNVLGTAGCVCRSVQLPKRPGTSVDAVDTAHGGQRRADLGR